MVAPPKMSHNMWGALDRQNHSLRVEEAGKTQREA